MAKVILQPVPADRGIETTQPCSAAGAGLRLPAKIAQVVKKLAVYLPGRQQRAAVESFIPRQSCDRESRLEFERFMHW